ncbi:MAG: hypothetical protein V7K61_23180, partial [Nostoc sp.]
ESSAFSDSNLLSGWLSYVRTGYRDSLGNESHVSVGSRLATGSKQYLISVIVTVWDEAHYAAT